MGKRTAPPISHKQEALKALEEVSGKLLQPKTLTPLVLIQIHATVEYARRNVEQIMELKRVRKEKAPAQAGESAQS